MVSENYITYILPGRGRRRRLGLLLVQTAEDGGQVPRAAAVRRAVLVLLLLRAARQEGHPGRAAPGPAGPDGRGRALPLPPAPPEEAAEGGRGAPGLRRGVRVRRGLRGLAGLQEVLLGHQEGRRWEEEEMRLLFRAPEMFFLFNNYCFSLKSPARTGSFAWPALSASWRSSCPPRETWSSRSSRGRPRRARMETRFDKARRAHFDNPKFVCLFVY